MSSQLYSQDKTIEKINYNDLNSKQKENYNYHKVAAALAEYGYESIRLNNDWQGADFIAVKDGATILKVQLKGRFTIDKKYIGKDIHMAFIEDGIVKMYKHDEAVEVISDKTKESDSWKVKGLYSWKKTPSQYEYIFTIL